MELVKADIIEQLIFSVGGKQVMLDFHLAELYEVETKRLNEQVKRNANRFPETFMFQLNQKEWDNLESQFATTNIPDVLRSQIATAKRRTLPYVFTEQGVAMLSAVLKSDTAVAASIQIMDAKNLCKKPEVNQVEPCFSYSRMDCQVNEIIKEMKDDGKKMRLVWK